jgi:hypothetical protein
MSLHDITAELMTVLMRCTDAEYAAAALVQFKQDVREQAFNEAADHMAWALKDTPEYGPWVADQLRHMANGTAPAAASSGAAAGDKQPETEAHPRRDRWRVEIYDPLAKEWAPGIPLLVRERAVERLETAQIHSPRWADDDTPVARRLVRETTTYTVEAGESNV